MIIAMVTMLIIMCLDKLVMGHSHDPEYEISFTNEPRKRDVADEPDREMKRKAEELVSDEN
jgi:hypothetical protein